MLMIFKKNGNRGDKRYFVFSKKLNAVFFIGYMFFSIGFAQKSFAETVTGGGYTVQQIISPINGNLTGNGYIVQQSAQQHGGLESGGGYIVSGVFGTSSISTPPSSGGGGGGSSGGGYFVFPTPTSTGTVVVITATSTETSPVIGSTCSSRITFSGPIDYGLSTNSKEDVKKLETFLNTYENEKLPVNGVYEKQDVAAVKRWQQKYRSYILDPMRLKNPTGTVYTLSQRQIERQTTKVCGEPIMISCPYFKIYTKYGDKGNEVKKVQQFLNIVRGEKVPVSGVYGPRTRDAVKRFQRFYRKDIVSIVTLSFTSGNWNVSTRTKANEVIGCDILK